MDLRSLQIDWPETPAFRLEFEPRRRRWPLAVAIAVSALAAAFAVPQSRGAILDLFDFGGATIERVRVLPPAQEEPLAAGLGSATSVAQAKDVLGRRPLLPPVRVRLYERGGVVSMLFTYAGEPVLLSEFRGGAAGILKKIAGPATTIETVPNGVWLQGAHVYLFPQAPPRLAGNVLLWQRGGLTLRLEGRSLTKAEALTISERIR
jgi:hypothetical protein